METCSSFDLKQSALHHCIPSFVMNVNELLTQCWHCSTVEVVAVNQLSSTKALLNLLLSNSDGMERHLQKALESIRTCIGDLPGL